MQSRNLYVGLMYILFSCSCGAQDIKNSYLEYSIPDYAVKKGPLPARGGQTSVIQYKDPKSGNVIAREFFDNKTGKKIELVLLKDGEKHGIQKEWYKNGSLKSESPYLNGIMSGVFKYWDDKGNLVGRYEIIEGNGIKKIYFPNGNLKEESHFKNNMLNGVNIVFYDNAKIQSLNWQKDNHPINSSFAFHENGQLYCYGEYDEDGRLNGPILYFDNNSLPIKNTFLYYIHGKKVSQEQYIAASENDPALPKLKDRIENYNKYLDEQAKNIIEKYIKMKPVDIPLK